MYNPSTYWDERLRRNFDFKGVGHQSFGLYYNRWLYHRKLKVLRHILRNFTLTGKRVLDVGCGTGFFTAWYLAQGAEVRGIDISPVSINRLKQVYPCAEFAVIDFANPDLRFIQKYDILNVWDVIYHQVDDTHYARFLANLGRAAERDALLICTDQFLGERTREVSEHVRFRSLDLYREHLEPLGFQLAAIYPLYRWLNRRYRLVQRLKFLQFILAPVFFLLEHFVRRPAKCNLSVAVWVKRS